MAKTPEGTVTFYTGTFPNTTAVNATGAGTADGTEWVKGLIDNFIFGPFQAWMDYASLTPDGITEAVGASQMIEAVIKGLGDGPGTVKMYHFNDDFATLGHRILPLHGQGVLRASYPELDAITWVGSANNATAPAYYRADVTGTIRSDTGTHLFLPESRGYTVRGLDTAASVDPQGASRFLGDNQVDSMQGHFHNYQTVDSGTVPGVDSYIAGLAFPGAFRTGTRNAIKSPLTDGINGTPRTSSETRMVNFSVNFGVVY